jgi:hypothetical protein
MSRPKGRPRGKGESFSILKRENEQAINAMYNRVSGKVKDNELLKDIHVLMRLCVQKGIYDETEDQRVFHYMLKGDGE